jgi:DNA-binding CsgD family transcriptional regulator
VARVAPDAPALASAMAVLGDGGRLAHATGIAGLDDESAARIAHQLRRIELLSTEDPFNFVHPLVRRSIYDRLSVSERDAAHARAADALRDAGARPESIAAHIALIRPAGSVEAVEALRAAAQHALARAAPEAAIAWLRRALDEDAAEPPRWALLAELGYAEIAIRNPAAIEHLSEALRGADDARWRARIYTALTEILVTTGQWEAGRKRTDAAFAELGEHEDPDVALEVVAMWAIATMSDSRSVEEFDRRRTSLNAAAAGANWPARALSATLAMEAALRGDRVETVVPLVERALRDGRLLAERGAGAWASAQALGALVTIDENDRALAATRELAAAARECGSVIGTYTADGTRAFVHARRGELAAAEAEVRTGIEMMTQAGMAMMVTSAVLVICDAIVERPTLDDVATLMETTELEPRFLETWGGAMLLESRARVRLARRDRAGAIADLRACAPVIAALGYGPTASVWRSVLALALPADDREEALGLAREEVALAKATGLARPYGVALRAAGVLEGGPAGIDLLRESVSVLEQTEARLELARSVVDLGAALRRSHRKAEAREHLGRGTELALRCGAERLVERAQDELRAAGARRRRRDISGAASLTASEQRVAHLAAAGASNAEIAQDLYVTLKTVETHLSHVYMKLGLSGQGARSRLAQALDEPD